MTTTTKSTQHDSGFFVYPSGGWRKWMFQAPLVLWRMGLGWMLPRQLLVLAATGRKSGLPRYTMIEYFNIDGTLHMVSGWGERSQWVKNIVADPVVTVESVNEGVIQGRAHRLTSEDEFRSLWQPMLRSPIAEPQLARWGMQRTVEDFIAKRDRAVIFAIEAGDVPAPPPLEQDLQWVPYFVGALLLTRLMRGGRKKR
ncbi:MAG: nitroreductase family deazaflavin-dependent oxidoreductase [Anaerolineae bacterium]|nr:nitroreductase family deazaflavin-dependent oxidoreductase [Anaerolineae bacterium]